MMSPESDICALAGWPAIRLAVTRLGRQMLPVLSNKQPIDHLHIRMQYRCQSSLGRRIEGHPP